MYRVFDCEDKKWIKNVYLSPNNDLYISKKNIFGREKLKLVSSNRYVVHRDIGLHDKNDNLIYEGDIVKARISEDATLKGLVSYAYELSSYIILCDETNEYFTLGNSVSEYVELIGNVFED